jgi:hypothetical protein
MFWASLKAASRLIRQSSLIALGLMTAGMSAVHTQAAYISEIDLGGPISLAGQGIELSQVDPASAYTLVLMNVSPASSATFGLVKDVIHLPVGSGFVNVTMLTDEPWPEDNPAIIPLASTDAGSSSLLLTQTTLLVVMQGNAPVRRFDNPLGSDALAAARYDASAVTDWLVLGQGNLAADFQSSSLDIASINTTLGIDLLGRLVNTDDATLIARTNAPGQPLDMDTFYVGKPDAARQFDVAGGYKYTYTPGMINTPLAHLPEPGSLASLAILSALCLRRSRR